MKPNYKLMKKHLFLYFFLSFFIFAGTGCLINEQGDTIDYEDDVQPLIEEVNETRRVRGSCNVIAASSTCIDYVGSFWSEQQMKLNCGQVGEFSTNTCPYTELGGCQMTGGTAVEVVTWSYDHGGQSISAEEAVYQAKACNALATGNWIHADDQLDM